MHYRFTLLTISFAFLLVATSSSIAQNCINMGGVNPTSYSQTFDGLGDSPAPQSSDAANVVILNPSGPRRYLGKWDNAVADSTAIVNVPGWAEIEEGTNIGAVSGRYGVGNGSNAGGNTYSFASATNPTDRALGSLNDDTIANNWLGGCFKNTSGSTVFAVSIAYTGEMWRRGGSATPDRLDFQFGVNATNIYAGTFTDFNALDFSTPDLTGGASNRDGNVAPNRTVFPFTSLPVTLAPNDSLYIRWHDSNIAGADDGLAIDDFQIKLLLPSAAGVSIAGRVEDANGRGVSRARLTLIDQNGHDSTVTTNPFGYYRFSDVSAGRSYVLSVFSKSFLFPRSSRVIQVDDELTDLDFVGSRP